MPRLPAFHSVIATAIFYVIATHQGCESCSCKMANSCQSTVVTTTPTVESTTPTTTGITLPDIGIRVEPSTPSPFSEWIPPGSCGRNLYYFSNIQGVVRENRILKGTNARENEIPWQVRVEITSFSSDAPGKYLCGGSIIANQWVVTAAHCIMSNAAFKVWYGGNDLTKALGASPAQATKHPNYNPITKDYDIALLRLAKPLVFNDRVQPICLPQSCADDCMFGDEGTISGFGTTYEDSDEPSSTLQKAAVTVASDDICRDSFKAHKINRTLTGRMMCAGDPGTLADSCRGDDGGPLACVPSNGGDRYHLTGVKSVVDKCGVRGFYSVYTQPCTVYDWIKKTTGDALTTSVTSSAPVITITPSPAPTQPNTATPTKVPVTINPATPSPSPPIDTIPQGSPPPTSPATPPATSPTMPPVVLTTHVPPQTEEWENDPVCGRKNVGAAFVRNTKANKIINGVNAFQNEFPWLVRLDVNGFLCGGSLINNQWILTAAHCIGESELSGGNPIVYLGAQFVDKRIPGELVLEANLALPHPDYNGDTHDNDIALLRLNKTVTFSKNILPICLLGSNCADEAQPNEGNCTIAGWGTTLEGALNPANVLQKAPVPIVSAADCQDAFTNNGQDTVVTDGMTCAGTSGIDTCQGDSGGPLVCHHPSVEDQSVYYLNGVTSFGYGCARDGYFGVYARPCYYVNWITTEINDPQNKKLRGKVIKPPTGKRPTTRRLRTTTKSATTKKATTARTMTTKKRNSTVSTVRTRRPVSPTTTKLAN